MNRIVKVVSVLGWLLVACGEDFATGSRDADATSTSATSGPTSGPTTGANASPSATTSAVTSNESGAEPGDNDTTTPAEPGPSFDGDASAMRPRPGDRFGADGGGLPNPGGWGGDIGGNFEPPSLEDGGRRPRRPNRDGGTRPARPSFGDGGYQGWGNADGGLRGWGGGRD